MTIAEIIDIEKGNFDKVNLVRGPLFWKAYEVSAFILSSQVSQFKATRRSIKTVGCDVVSVGFPISVESKYVSSLHLVSETNVVKTFSTDVPVSQSDFNKWKSDCVIDYDDNIDRPVECVNNNCDDNLRDRLSSLNLATMTPFDALAFLVDLQKELTLHK